MKKAITRAGESCRPVNAILHYFRIKFCCAKKRFGFYFDHSEAKLGETSFLHVKKSFRSITNHDLSELCFRGLFRGHRGYVGWL